VERAGRLPVSSLRKAQRLHQMLRDLSAGNKADLAAKRPSGRSSINRNAV
jgi:hypothetical protein